MADVADVCSLCFEAYPRDSRLIYEKCFRVNGHRQTRHLVPVRWSPERNVLECLDPFHASGVRPRPSVKLKGKFVLCREWPGCSYGDKCTYAHSMEELVMWNSQVPGDSLVEAPIANPPVQQVYDFQQSNSREWPTLAQQPRPTPFATSPGAKSWAQATATRQRRGNIRPLNPLSVHPVPIKLHHKPQSSSFGRPVQNPLLQHGGIGRSHSDGVIRHAESQHQHNESETPRTHFTNRKRAQSESTRGLATLAESSNSPSSWTTNTQPNRQSQGLDVSSPLMVDDQPLASPPSNSSRIYHYQPTTSPQAPSRGPTQVGSPAERQQGLHAQQSPHQQGPLVQTHGNIPPSGQGGWIPSPEHGGWIPPARQGGWTPPPGQGGWTPPPGQGGWIPPPGQGSWIPPPGHGGWIPSARQGGWNPPPEQWNPIPPPSQQIQNHQQRFANPHLPLQQLVQSSNKTTEWPFFDFHPQKIQPSPPHMPSTQSVSSIRQGSDMIPGTGGRTESCKDILSAKNYKNKFLALLDAEQTEHETILKNKCDGEYQLFLSPPEAKGPSERKRQASISQSYSRNGHLEGLTGDQIAYVAQASQGWLFIQNRGRTICRAHILPENYNHTEDILFIAFEARDEQSLYREFPLSQTRSHVSFPVMVRFELKRSYFKSLTNFVKKLNNPVIKKIMPTPVCFSVEPLPILVNLNSKSILCSKDQFKALQAIMACPPNGPPSIIVGPFGTGKTRILALASSCFFDEARQRGKPARVLVCTQQRESGDNFYHQYKKLELSEKPDLEICILRDRVFSHPDIDMRVFKSVQMFQSYIEQRYKRTTNHLLLITTCSTAQQLSRFIDDKFFSHILIDEGAQMREPEAIGPLALASPISTKIVIAGDQNQVGPSMLVLGEIPQKYGLATSILERLYSTYKKCRQESYISILVTSYRSHSYIVELPSALFYETPLIVASDTPSLHPSHSYPLCFVCSSVDETISKVVANTNEREAKILLDEITDVAISWPASWHQQDLSQTCFMSVARPQLTVFNQLISRNNLKSKLGPMKRLPTYDMQGREFLALFLSTSEPTNTDGSTSNPTKSLCDRFVFNTALTRAKSLVVAAGNPFLLLKTEQHMVTKYGDKGKVWSNYLKRCLDHNSFTIPTSLDVPESHVKSIKSKLRHLILERTNGVTSGDGQIAEIDEIPSLDPPTSLPSLQASSPQHPAPSHHNVPLQQSVEKGASSQPVEHLVNLHQSFPQPTLGLLPNPTQTKQSLHLPDRQSALIPRQPHIQEDTSRLFDFDNELDNRGQQPTRPEGVMMKPKHSRGSPDPSVGGGDEMRPNLSSGTQGLGDNTWSPLLPRPLRTSTEESGINNDTDRKTPSPTPSSASEGKGSDVARTISQSRNENDLKPPYGHGSQSASNSTLENQFQLVDRLGSGAFGVVFHVQHKFDESEYALKIIRLPNKMKQQKMVKREIRALANLHHQHIVRYHTSWEEEVPSSWLEASSLMSTESSASVYKTDESFLATRQSPAHTHTNTRKPSGSSSSVASSDSVVTFRNDSEPVPPVEPIKNRVPAERESKRSPTCLIIQTELCEKDTLRNWLDKNCEEKSRKKKVVLAYFEQILSALKYIHKELFVHRDLKPSNIFFSRSEQILKIGDFGLVTTGIVTHTEGVEGVGATNSHSQSSKRYGTYLYMSPEQRDKKNCDAKSDMFSLGIIFFELQYPMKTQQERSKVLENIHKDTPVFPDMFTERQYDEVSKIILLLVSNHPDERPTAHGLEESEDLKKLKKKVRKKKDT